MQTLAIVPSWFSGFNAALDVVFAIVTFLLFYYSIKIFRIIQRTRVLLYGLAFLSISASYIVQSFFDFSTAGQVPEWGLYSIIFFYTLGTVLLAFVCLRSREIKMFSLILVLSLLSISLTANKVTAFYIVSSILFIFVSLHYFDNYRSNRQFKTLIIFVAFIFLLFGKIHYIFALNHGEYTVIGHMLELVAYILIFYGLLRTIRK